MPCRCLLKRGNRNAAVLTPELVCVDQSVAMEVGVGPVLQRRACLAPAVEHRHIRPYQPSPSLHRPHPQIGVLEVTTLVDLVKAPQGQISLPREQEAASGG